MPHESGAAIVSARQPRRWLTAPPFRPTSLATGLVLLLLLYWGVGLRPVWAAFKAFEPAMFLLYLLTAAGVRAGSSLRWQLLARRLGPVPVFSTFAAARLAGDAISALAPVGRVGGDPVRIGLLYGEGVKGSQASAGVVIDRIVEVAGNSFAAIAYVTVCAIAYAGASATARAPVVIGALVLPLMALLFLLVQWHRTMRPLTRLAGAIGPGGRRWWARWLVALRHTEDDLGRVCSEHPVLLLSGLAASLLIESVIIVEYYFLFRTFGVFLDVPSLLLVIMATGLSRAAPVPAGLGAMEASQVAMVSAASGSPQVGLVVATLVRLHESLWLCAGVAALWAQGVSLSRLRSLWWPQRATT